jgi:hypothetical protein
MNEADFIVKQFTRYGKKELWKTGARYELRTRRHGSDENPAAVTALSDDDALKFQQEANRQQSIWDKIDAEHDLVASYSVKNWHLELQRMPDGCHRVVSFQSPLETADDFTIHPAEAATIAEFLEQAGRWNDRDWQEHLASKSNQEYCRG